MARKSQMETIRKSDADIQRTVNDALYIKNRGYAKLNSYRGEREVTMGWGGRSEEAEQLGHFEIIVGDKKAVISKEQLQFYLRNV